MIATGAFGIIVLGTALACVSERYPRVAARIETMSGLCVVGGLALIGGAMPGFH